jgi:multiple sugar transport system ATP-binding protein
VPLPQDLREKVGRASGKTLIAGLRPEDIEDASMLASGVRERGGTFRARIEVLESMGSELYAHFSVGAEQIESQELRELAEDAGAAEVPSSGEEGRIVARLDPESRVKEGEEAELWADASKLHLFEPDSGRSLTA